MYLNFLNPLKIFIKIKCIKKNKTQFYIFKIVLNKKVFLKKIKY